jgi:hypothetical protein
MPEPSPAPEIVERPKAAPSRGLSNSSRKRIANRVGSLICLAVAAIVQYYLVNIPTGEVGGQFPAAVRARAEAVTFNRPGLPDGGTFSLQYAPPTEAEPVLVDAYFENAQLAPETLQQFRALQVTPPTASGLISYLTSTVKKGSCSTKFAVAPVSAPASVRFAQTDDDALAGLRSLAIAFTGTDTEITLTSQGPMQSLVSPCKVELSIGNWTQITGGFFPIRIRIPDGATFRFRWQNLGEKSDTWKNQGAALQLVRFGGSNSDDFTASAIQIASVRNPGNPPLLQALGEKNTPLEVESFAIDKSALAIKASGRGKVLKDGSVVTKTDLLETLNKNPILSGLFAAGNIALLGWAGRSWFPKRKKEEDDA